MSPTPPNPTLPPVLDVLAAGVREGVAPAMAAVVLSRGELVHESWHGLAQRVPVERPLAAGDRFDLASLTKVVCTTTVAACLVEAGALEVEAPVGRYVPGLERPSTRDVRIRHLLAHTSGLVWWRPYFETVARDPVAAAILSPAGDGATRAAAFARSRELVLAAVAAEEPERRPGEQAVYSDVGFLALELALEAAGGDRLDRLFDVRVAGPLGLASTLFVPELEPAFAADARARHRFVATEQCAWRGEVCCGVVGDENAYALGGVAGHAGLFSTAGDVARLGQAWLDAIDGRPGSLVRRATAERFARRDGPSAGTRALGWDTPSAENSSIGSRLGRGPRGAIGHLGFTGTSLWIDLDHGLVCVLLTNRVHPSRTTDGLKAFRPRFHDTVARALGI